MGIPDQPFWAPEEVVATYRDTVRQRVQDAKAAWVEAFDALDGDERAAWDAAWNGTGLKGWEDALPTFEQGKEEATRQAMAKVLGAVFDQFPGMISGAADLTGNTGVKLSADAGHQTAENPGGRQIYYGIREHAMGAASVGMAMHGGILPFTGTFFVFLDYMRPPVRLAALSKAKVVFVWSHDSVGVGEDGPTHQPIEHLATLRAIPDLQVIRPADANETVAAFRTAVGHDEGPTAIVLTRQGVPVCTDGSAVERGGGIVADVEGPGAGHRRHRQRGVGRAGRRQAAHGRGDRDPCRQPAELGPAARPRSGVPGDPVPCRACRCSPWRPPRRSAGPSSPTPRSGSTASASARRAARCCSASASTSSTSWRRLARS